ncbi:DUF707 domain-containing protein [Clostridium tyrobutyricum]|uniref:DUF707 domain-containing protein n=1 Tax=Clostridium tyrobutyricum TaxID=1519 RepID=UPI0002D2AF0F|nr:DUF707 domain-containing protein [Clostridium tyrobutyricum]
MNLYENKSIKDYGKNLIICRAGDNSLHKNWINNKYRNFDLLINYYGNEENKYIDDAKYYVMSGGTKYQEIYKLIEKNKFIIDKYDSIMLADDDILTNTENLSQLFDIFNYYKLDLAQPSLTLDSFFSHPITLQNKECILRYTNFVEVMIPIFSKNALKLCINTFKETKLCWGLDYIWPKLLKYKNIAIIDSNPVKHTRKVGNGDLYINLNVNIFDEFKYLLSKYNVNQYNHKYYDFIDLHTNKIIRKQDKNYKSIKYNSLLKSLPKDIFLNHTYTIYLKNMIESDFDKSAKSMQDIDVLNNICKCKKNIINNTRKKILNNIFLNCKNIGIYGTGKHTEKMISCYKKIFKDKNNVKIYYFDSDPNKWNKNFLDSIILNPNKINNLNLDKIVISSFSYQDEIYKKLKLLVNNKISIIKIYNNNLIGLNVFNVNS